MSSFPQLNPLHPLLKEFAELVVAERRMREADISDGSRVPHGSTKHVRDLETRIRSLVMFRDAQRRGSETRANYSRLVSRLRGELASAKRSAAKQKDNLKETTATVSENDDTELVSPQDRWAALARGSGDELIDRVVAAFRSAATPRDLATVKRRVIKKMDADEMPAAITDGFVSWLYDQRRAELQQMNYQPRSSADARIDRILRTRDSTGKATARK